MQQAITIMADFGNGPYAWNKDSSDKTTNVGGNIADAVGGFYGFIEISKELENDLASWVLEFERDYEKEPFDWRAFNERGIELSRRLKREVKDAFDVAYSFPWEDPVHGRDPDMKIE
jgi:hypothetical protein